MSRFDNPATGPDLYMATSNINKQLVFSTPSGIFSNDAKVAFSYMDDAVSSYVVGSGLTMSEDNQTLTLTLNGSEFTSYPNRKLTGEVTLFADGDRDIIFTLTVRDSNL